MANNTELNRYQGVRGAEGQGQPWAYKHLGKLRDVGMPLVGAKDAGVLSPAFVAYHDAKAVETVRGWAISKDPVEISIVIVTPNNGIGSLPSRSLSYAASALNLITATRERQGVNIDTLRVMSPCHANAYVNGGSHTNQIVNAESMRRLVEAYKNEYHPSLADLEVTLDVGKAVTPDVEEELLPAAERIAKEYPHIADELEQVAASYNQNGHEDSPEMAYLRPLIYLLTHPPAWGYSMEEHLFARNGERRINFMPGSELRYLGHIMEIGKGGIWQPAEDKRIVTAVAEKQQKPPYYPAWKGAFEGGIDNKGEAIELTDPTLLDLAAPATGLPKRGLAACFSQLSKYTGRTEIAEVVTNLNQLKTDGEQANSRRVKAGVAGKAKPLGELIRDVLGIYGEQMKQTGSAN